MKSTLKTIKTLTLKGKFSLFAYYFLLFAFCFLAGLQCDQPLRKPAEWPRNLSVAELVPEATSIIEQGLADQNPYVRGNAIEVVGTTKRITLMPQVQRLLEKDFESPVRFDAALALADADYLLAERALRPLLTDPDENLRIAAAYALSKLGAMDSADSFDLLCRAIASDDQIVRANAAFLLGKSGNKEALKLLLIAMRLRDSSDKVRFQAVESIAALGHERIFPKLWAMVVSTYADDRIMGIRAMGALGTAQAKNVLITKLDDDVLVVRLTAAEQLGILGDNTGEPEVLDVFAKNLTAGLGPEETEHVNMLTALAIGQIRGDRLIRFLPRLLRDQSPFVRIAAAKAVFQCAIKH